MKVAYFILGILLGMLLYEVAHAEDWSKSDTARQGVFTGLTVLDWAQTRYISKHPENYRETNHFLGDHPTTGKVDNYFATAIVGHAVIAYLLPPAWRQGWQYVWIGVEVQKVGHNHSIGIKLSF